MHVDNALLHLMTNDAPTTTVTAGDRSLAAGAGAGAASAAAGTSTSAPAAPATSAGHGDGDGDISPGATATAVRAALVQGAAHRVQAIVGACYDSARLVQLCLPRVYLRRAAEYGGAHHRTKKRKRAKNAAPQPISALEFLQSATQLDRGAVRELLPPWRPLALIVLPVVLLCRWTWHCWTRALRSWFGCTTQQRTLYWP